MGKNRHKKGTIYMERVRMGKITTNLRKRIKEKGYTREQFAEICGIPEETLKKYLSRDDYPTRWLKVFADELDCTYDYLLGKSGVPEREYMDARNETRLSVESIDNLKKHNDNGIMFETINVILENESVWKALALYMVSDIAKPMIEGNINETLEKYNADNETDFLLNEIPKAKVTAQITLINALDNIKIKYAEKEVISKLNKAMKK
ncbi:MAG: helix-turn-helix transcriptional regulator [Lachnospiraceae bacterium]|nr:helix-turn-helix transcriptional regulator [Lachnospiraceae bacterium]